MSIRNKLIAEFVVALILSLIVVSCMCIYVNADESSTSIPSGYVDMRDVFGFTDKSVALSDDKVHSVFDDKKLNMSDYMQPLYQYSNTKPDYTLFHPSSSGFIALQSSFKDSDDVTHSINDFNQFFIFNDFVRHQTWVILLKCESPVYYFQGTFYSNSSFVCAYGCVTSLSSDVNSTDNHFKVDFTCKSFLKKTDLSYKNNDTDNDSISFKAYTFSIFYGSDGSQESKMLWFTSTPQYAVLNNPNLYGSPFYPKPQKLMNYILSSSDPSTDSNLINICSNSDSFNFVNGTGGGSGAADNSKSSSHLQPTKEGTYCLFLNSNASSGTFRVGIGVDNYILNHLDDYRVFITYSLQIGFDAPDYKYDTVVDRVSRVNPFDNVNLSSSYKNILKQFPGYDGTLNSITQHLVNPKINLHFNDTFNFKENLPLRDFEGSNGYKNFDISKYIVNLKNDKGESANYICQYLDSNCDWSPQYPTSTTGGITVGNSAIEIGGTATQSKANGRNLTLQKLNYVISFHLYAKSSGESGKSDVFTSNLVSGNNSSSDVLLSDGEVPKEDTNGDGVVDDNDEVDYASRPVTSTGSQRWSGASPASGSSSSSIEKGAIVINNNPQFTNNNNLSSFSGGSGDVGSQSHNLNSNANGVIDNTLNSLTKGTDSSGNDTGGFMNLISSAFGYVPSGVWTPIILAASIIAVIAVVAFIVHLL